MVHPAPGLENEQDLVLGQTLSLSGREVDDLAVGVQGNLLPFGADNLELWQWAIQDEEGTVEVCITQERIGL